MKTKSRWQGSSSLAYVVSAVMVFASVAEAQRGGGGARGGGSSGGSSRSGGGGMSSAPSRSSGGSSGPSRSAPPRSSGGYSGPSRSAPSVSAPRSEPRSAPSRSSGGYSGPARSAPSVSAPRSAPRGDIGNRTGNRPNNGNIGNRPNVGNRNGDIGNRTGNRPNNGNIGNRPNVGNRNGDVGNRPNAGNRNGNIGNRPSNRGNADLGRNNGRINNPRVSRGARSAATNYRSRPVNSGRSYVQRSRVRHDFGRNRYNVVRNYNAYYWGRIGVYSYRPYYAYQTNFWGWYYSPFYSPWSYTWGWYSAPWYGYWNWYWSPYTTYSTPSYYVTDYVLSSRLNDTYERGYQNGYVDGVEASRNQPITADMKAQINVQTQQVSKAFEEDKAVELNDALEDSKFLFVVDESISVKTTDGKKCKLLGADLLKVAEQVEEGAKAVRMEVVAGKGSCEAGSIVTISAKDLQEMLNGFAEAVDEGMNELQSKQDKGEIPVRAKP